MIVQNKPDQKKAAMLGRTANSLYWMFRYLERAENTARLIEAGLRMALTKDIVTSEEEWRSVIETAGQRAAYERNHGTYTGVQVWNYMLRDRKNPASIMSMMEEVRTNARLSRNSISGELWEAINESWMTMKDMMARPVSQGSVGEVVSHDPASGNAGPWRDGRVHAARRGI